MFDMKAHSIYREYSQPQSHICLLIRPFEVNLEDTCTRFKKHPRKPDISRSFIRIFEVNLEDTCTRFEKY